MIESIPANDNIQIIVVDDNSKDANIKLKNLNGKFPNVEFYSNNSENKGAGAARNTALNYVKGSWILFADADDFFAKNFFSIVNYYVNFEHDVIYFQPNSISEIGEPSNRHKKYSQYVEDYINVPNKRNLNKLLYLHNVPWSKLIKTSLINRNDIKFEEIMYSNDMLFSAKIGYYAKEILAVKKNIYTVTESSGSLTKTINENSLQIRFKAWVEYTLFIKEVLKKEEFNDLHLAASHYIFSVIKNKLPVKNIGEILKISIKKELPIVDMRIFDIRKLLNFIKRL